MKYVDLKKYTDDNGACPIYLLEGEECYFKERGEAMLKTRFVQETTLDYIAFDGNALKGDKIKSLTDAWAAFPFLSEKRMVKISEYYPTEKEYETYLQSYFENPPQDSILLIVNGGKGKPGTVAWSKKPNVTYVDCSRSDEETIKKWICVTCKRAGVYADGITAGKIAAFCLYDMSRISKETEKLLCYCEAEKKERLTDEIVEMMVYPDSEYKIYELANALSRKNYSAFMHIQKDLLTQGFNETSLLSSLCSYFKGLYDVANCKGSDREVALSLGLKEFAVKKNREQAQRMGKAEVLAAYEEVYGAISGIKCGELSPDSAWKRVITKLFFENS